MATTPRKLGKRPVVFVFAKTPSDALARLVRELDKVAAENEDAKRASVINFTDEPSDEYTAKIEQFGEKLDLKHTALTLSSDGGKFKVNEDAELTVMHYKGKKVAYNFAGGKESLTDAAIKQIVAGTKTILE